MASLKPYAEKQAAISKVLESDSKTKAEEIVSIILDGSPNEGKVGELFFLIHHGVLCERLEEPLINRVRYVLIQKPAKERLVRLTEMTPVLNAPKNIAKARYAYDKALGAYYKARDAYSKALDAYNEAWDAKCKALGACDKALDAYYKALGAYNEAWDAKCKALDAYDWTAHHKKQVPETTWDGKTIKGCAS